MYIQRLTDLFTEIFASVLWICDTFEDHVGSKHKFTKHSKESWLYSGQYFLNIFQNMLLYERYLNSLVVLCSLMQQA